MSRKLMVTFIACLLTAGIVPADADSLACGGSIGPTISPTADAQDCVVDGAPDAFDGADPSEPGDARGRLGNPLLNLPVRGDQNDGWTVTIEVAEGVDAAGEPSYDQAVAVPGGLEDYTFQFTVKRYDTTTGLMADAGIDPSYFVFKLLSCDAGNTCPSDAGGSNTFDAIFYAQGSIGNGFVKRADGVYAVTVPGDKMPTVGESFVPWVWADVPEHDEFCPEGECDAIDAVSAYHSHPANLAEDHDPVMDLFTWAATPIEMQAAEAPGEPGPTAAPLADGFVASFSQAGLPADILSPDANGDITVDASVYSFQDGVYAPHTGMVQFGVVPDDGQPGSYGGPGDVILTGSPDPAGQVSFTFPVSDLSGASTYVLYMKQYPAVPVEPTSYHVTHKALLHGACGDDAALCSLAAEASDLLDVEDFLGNTGYRPYTPVVVLDTSDYTFSGQISPPVGAPTVTWEGAGFDVTLTGADLSAFEPTDATNVFVQIAPTADEGPAISRATSCFLHGAGMIDARLTDNVFAFDGSECPEGYLAGRGSDGNTFVQVYIDESGDGSSGATGQDGVVHYHGLNPMGLPLSIDAACAGATDEPCLAAATHDVVVNGGFEGIRTKTSHLPDGDYETSWRGDVLILGKVAVAPDAGVDKSDAIDIGIEGSIDYNDVYGFSTQNTHNEVYMSVEGAPLLASYERFRVDVHAPNALGESARHVLLLFVTETDAEGNVHRDCLAARPASVVPSSQYTTRTWDSTAEFRGGTCHRGGELQFDTSYQPLTAWKTQHPSATIQMVDLRLITTIDAVWPAESPLYIDNAHLAVVQGLEAPQLPAALGDGFFTTITPLNGVMTPVGTAMEPTLFGSYYFDVCAFDGTGQPYGFSDYRLELIGLPGADAADVDEPFTAYAVGTYGPTDRTVADNDGDHCIRVSVPEREVKGLVGPDAIYQVAFWTPFEATGKVGYYNEFVNALVGQDVIPADTARIADELDETRASGVMMLPRGTTGGIL